MSNGLVMSSRKHLIIAILLFVAVVAVGWFVAVRPAYRTADSLERETAGFRDRASNMAVRQDEIDKLTIRRDAAQHQIDKVLKQIPPTPNVSDVSRHWAFPIDGATVLDREYTAGNDRPALPDFDVGFMAAPMTVNIVATFDAIFALVQVAESLPQLVRVNSVTIACDRRKNEGAPIGEATIALEVIYQPPDPSEGS